MTDHESIRRKIAEKLRWTDLHKTGRSKPEGTYCLKGRTPQLGMIHSVPHWSEDANAAFELWPYLQRVGAPLYVLTQQPSSDWIVWDNSNNKVISSASTPCLAICLAFLGEKG